MRQAHPGLQSPLSPTDLRQAARGPLGTLFGLKRLARIYEQVEQRSDPDEFLVAALKLLQVEWWASDSDLGRVPTSGPLVVVANHPFGGLEGMALALALRRVRPDLRILANGILQAIPELAPLLIPLDPFERPSSVAANLRGLRTALAWLRQGGALAMFPSGEVAHLHPHRLRVDEPRWRDTVVRLVRHTQAKVLPVFIPGANNAAFQLLGLLHPALRTALLPRQLLNKRGKTIRMVIGEPIAAAALSHGDQREVAEQLRKRTLLLAQRPARRQVRSPAHTTPLAPPQPPEFLRAEVDRLGTEHLLVSSGEFAVYWAEAKRIPHLLREIGVRREETFRCAGEGTGRELDLDRFDTSYFHLFLWNRHRLELAGAYRLGRIDHLLAQGGLQALYTSTLFRYRRELFSHLGPALELGRSFIRPEYQRSFSALLLLWRGIGEFVVRHPQYRYLLGPVSISAQYQPLSRAVIASYLWQQKRHPRLSGLVRPRKPFRTPLRHRQAARDLRDLDEVSALVAHLEGDQKGVPVLLRQYLKLGASVLGLNVDPQFSNVLDALVVVDLASAEPRVLERYMGKEGASSFLAAHAPEGDLSQAQVS